MANCVPEHASCGHVLILTGSYRRYFVQGDNFYCAGIQPIPGMIGIIGRQDIGGSAKVPLTPTPPPSGLTSNPLPTTEQQRSPHGHAVAPAIAGKATPKPSAASPDAVSRHCAMSSLLLSLVLCLCLI
ncbi:hypothetical protein CQW23_10394 [Capsicum baccatum]|uniref:Uncharacterized protein n=1 Tax=Capsicum baccatum TaxID=33114 RepID=A0A2G2WZH0_CAPBA|nr:hypothetical protein CQW23_10394 [Capsicum baccatum]